MTPAEIAESARETQPHVISLSILSGSHLPLMEEVIARLHVSGQRHIPVTVRGILPDSDMDRLLGMGLA